MNPHAPHHAAHDPRADSGAEPSFRTHATFNHLVGLLALLDGMGLISLISTIVLWRIRAHDSPFLDDHGREATNFQLSQIIYVVLGGIALGLFTAITIGVGIVIALPVFLVGLFVLIVVRVVGCIRGAMAANRGQYYRYPMTIRILSGPADA